MILRCYTQSISKRRITEKMEGGELGIRNEELGMPPTQPPISDFGFRIFARPPMQKLGMRN